MSPEASSNVFERVNDAAPERLENRDFRGLDRRYVVFEYETDPGIGLITSDEVRQILEEENENGLPMFRGIEASEAYIRTAVERDEGLMTARIEDGEIYSTGYMIEDQELKGLITFLD